MARRHFLRQVRDPKNNRPLPASPTVAALIELLSRQVVERFRRMSHLKAQAVALAVCEPHEDDVPRNPSHPACAEYAASDYCRESWQLHLEQLKQRPETHSGTCAHRRRCGIVPVVCGRRCLAVVKLAGAVPLDRSEFSRHLELLELLVRDFVGSHAAFLRRVPGGVSIGPPEPAPPEATEGGKAPLPPTHPQVTRAIKHISAHLSDPRLTVARVAGELSIYPTYLSELFVEHVGQRMSRYIVEQRLAKAKTLLATTDWQIKRIAIETGFANPNWFSHVFSVHTGLTPGEFRKTVSSD